MSPAAEHGLTLTGSWAEKNSVAMEKHTQLTKFAFSLDILFCSSDFNFSFKASFSLFRSLICFYNKQWNVEHKLASRHQKHSKCTQKHYPNHTNLRNGDILGGVGVSQIDSPPVIPASREAYPQVISFPLHGFSWFLKRRDFFWRQWHPMRSLYSTVVRACRSKSWLWSSRTMLLYIRKMLS